MFVAPFTAVGLFNLAANRRTSGARSGAYAHIRKLHGLTGELTVWPAIADFDTSAHMYSLVQTARANELEPYAYLCRLFAELPVAQTVEQIEALLPWNIKS